MLDANARNETGLPFYFGSPVRGAIAPMTAIFNLSRVYLQERFLLCGVLLGV